MTVRIYLDTNVFIDAFESDDAPVTRLARALGIKAVKLDEFVVANIEALS